MSQDILLKKHHQTFENIRHVDEKGKEFWLARELRSLLAYHEYRNFLPVVEKAKNCCKKSGFSISDHFVEINDMMDKDTGSNRKISNIKLSRYACCLIVQNVNPAKSVLALGQTNF